MTIREQQVTGKKKNNYSRLADNNQHREINHQRSSSEFRAASSDFGLIGIEEKRLNSVRLSTQNKAFFNFQSSGFSTDSASPAQEIQRAMPSSTWLSVQPKVVITGVYSRYFSLIPLSFYDINQPLPTVKIDQNETNNLELVDKLNDLDLVIRYQFDETLANEIRKIVPKAQFRFLYSGWLIQLKLKSQNQKYLVGIHAAQNHVAIALFKKGVLHLFNTFPKENEQDVSYFGLYSIQELGFPVAQCHLQLSGSSTETEALLPVLNQYIKAVELVETPTEFTSENSEEFSRFYPINQLYLCV